MRMTKNKFDMYLKGVARRTGFDIRWRRNCLNWIEIHVIADRKLLKHWQICVKTYSEACLLLETIEKTLFLLQED